jgi:hypothetical protein
MGLEKARHQGQQVVQAEGHVAVDPDAAARGGAGRHLALGLGDIREDAQGALVKGAALGGEQQLARRAAEEPRTEPRLQPCHELAHRRGRHPAGAGGRRESTQRHDPREHLHLTRAVDLRPRHS